MATAEIEGNHQGHIIRLAGCGGPAEYGDQAFISGIYLDDFFVANLRILGAGEKAIVQIFEGERFAKNFE